MLELNGPVSNGYFGLGVVLTGLLYPAVGTESQTAQLLGSWWRQVSPAACLPQMPFVLVFVKLHLILPANHSNPFPNPPTTPLDRWGGTERPERAPSWDSRHLEHPGTPENTVLGETMGNPCAHWMIRKLHAVPNPNGFESNVKVLQWFWKKFC